MNLFLFHIFVKEPCFDLYSLVRFEENRDQGQKSILLSLKIIKNDFYAPKRGVGCGNLD